MDQAFRIRAVRLAVWVVVGAAIVSQAATSCPAQAQDGPTVVVVDTAKALGPNDRFWANAVFHPTEYMDSDWGKRHVKLLHDGGVTTNFIRFYNQFEDAAYLKDDGTLGYRWDHFYRRADWAVAQGSKLLISFYSMPPQIVADAKRYRQRPFLNGKKIYIGPPKDYRQWQEACADFTRHVIQRYGEDRVAQWRFTCWNEPDLAGFWYKGDVVEYRKVYDYFAAGVKSVSRRVPIGGPAFSSSHIYKNPELLKEFFQHITSGKNHATGQSGSPIDYIAMHTYGGHGAGGSSVDKYPSVDYLMDQQKRIVAMRDEFPQLRRVPIVFQEWGVTSSGGTGIDKQPLAEVRNTSFAPAFLATMIARQLDWRRSDDPRVSDLFVCLSGYEKERLRDFEGKRTVQTLHGFDKPLLNGYRLLGRLGPEWVACSLKPAAKEISALAARDADRQVAVVVTHFCNDQVRGDGPARAVAVKALTPWPDGTRVEVRHWRVDSRHSNAYTVFCEQGKPNPPDAAQTAEIRKRMGLEQLETPRQIAIQGPVELRFDLPCNAVSLVEMVKLN